MKAISDQLHTMESFLKSYDCDVEDMTIDRRVLYAKSTLLYKVLNGLILSFYKCLKRGLERGLVKHRFAKNCISVWGPKIGNNLR